MAARLLLLLRFFLRFVWSSRTRNNEKFGLPGSSSGVSNHLFRKAFRNSSCSACSGPAPSACLSRQSFLPFIMGLLLVASCYCLEVRVMMMMMMMLQFAIIHQYSVHQSSKHQNREPRNNYHKPPTQNTTNDRRTKRVMSDEGVRFDGCSLSVV